MSLMCSTYSKEALPSSINIPYATAFTADGTLDSAVIFCSKGKIVIIIGSCKDKLSSEFATRLVRLEYSHVCTLHGGIEVLRKTGLLVSK
ncbi:TBC domain-containing protein kinase-like protein [Trichonephila clavata]|uniref:TBC domain-containing protein kinase-like protein n=1 Tax=Trichonephila clavata TaxID=2740835 RepID=A0A8X6LU50_TRICU|nr:TBC domain-containing protein kinase-like protein [Trichonephila clavata]